MIRLFILSSVLTSLDAFRLAPPSPLLLHGAASRDSTVMATTSSPPLPRCRASSPLRAAAAEGDVDAAAAEGGIPEETKASSDVVGDVSDILNSPAFLNRKVEVLKSDIAALEKELEEANAVASAAKEEWGAKFDMLNKEVSEALSSTMHLYGWRELHYSRSRQHHSSSRYLICLFFVTH
jgi:hypothetical protein